MLACAHMPIKGPGEKGRLKAQELNALKFKTMRWNNGMKIDSKIELDGRCAFYALGNVVTDMPLFHYTIESTPTVRNYPWTRFYVQKKNKKQHFNRVYKNNIDLIKELLINFNVYLLEIPSVTISQLYRPLCPLRNIQHPTCNFRINLVQRARFLLLPAGSSTKQTVG